MQSLFIEELLRLFFSNCNYNPQLFVPNFNQSSSIIAFNFRCRKHKFTHVSNSFKTILGYHKQNILKNGGFTTKIVHPQDINVIKNCLSSSSESDQQEKESSDFYQFRHVKCRAKHIHGYWKYFTIFAEGYWNNKEQTNDKIGLIVDERIKSEDLKKPKEKKQTKQNDPNESSDIQLFWDSTITSNGHTFSHYISPRENEVLELISNGLLTKEIASKLHISDSTVVTHRKNLLCKMKVRNTAELIKKAAQEMLI